MHCRLMCASVHYPRPTWPLALICLPDLTRSRKIFHTLRQKGLLSNADVLSTGYFTPETCDASWKYAFSHSRQSWACCRVWPALCLAIPALTPLLSSSERSRILVTPSWSDFTSQKPSGEWKYPTHLLSSMLARKKFTRCSNLLSPGPIGLIWSK